MKLKIEEIVKIATRADRLARFIGQRFELDEEILEQQGFSSLEIDQIFAMIDEEEKCYG